MINCEVCGGSLKLIDNDYVCEEGHTISNSLEVATDMAPLLDRPASSESERPRFVFPTAKYGPDYADLLLFYMLFEDVRKHLHIKSSKYFDIFTNFIQEGPEKTLLMPWAGPVSISALAYYSKRVETEADGGTYMYLDYYQEMEPYPYEERRREKVNFLRGRNPNAFRMQPGAFGLDPVHEVLKYLGDRGFSLARVRVKGVLRTFYDETGVPNDEVESNKACFRQDLRRDYQMLFKYLQRVCGMFMLGIDDDLEAKFKVFFYAHDLTQHIHIPEVDVSVFLYVYIMNHRKDFDALRAVRALEGSAIGLYPPLQEGTGSHAPHPTDPCSTTSPGPSLELHLKALIAKVAWISAATVDSKVSELMRLFDCSRSAGALARYWRRRNYKYMTIFNRNAWHVKRLMVLKKKSSGALHMPSPGAT